MLIPQGASTTEVAATTYIPYSETGYYSKIITDYLQQSPELKPFYQHEVTIEGVKAAIQQRQAFPQNREALVALLNQQYNGLEISDKLAQNIALLAQPNTYTITTAHQPVIFTGPLYFAYKILHVIKIAQQLSSELPDSNFVPVFYMGSEDADLDELGTTYVDAKLYKWNTKQTGAVGRMKVDKEFITLLNELEQQINVQEFGAEIIDVFRRCYRPGALIQQASLEVINELYGSYGLVVLIPDTAEVKRLFAPVIAKELTSQFSHKKVAETITELAKYYKVQAGGRDINLFYLVNDKRERIERSGENFTVPALDLSFTEAEILQELEAHPGRFSPNVILRGALQETVLPNIAFIGGGGELAYWLELKSVFQTVNIPYPILILRNSFLFINPNQKEKIDKLGLDEKELFAEAQTITNNLVKRTAGKQLSLDEEQEYLQNFYNYLEAITSRIDPTLQTHVKALSTHASQKITELQKKMLRAERRKYETQERQIATLKATLFPNKSLQERVENISGFYSRYGKQFIEIAYQNSFAFEQQFGVVYL